MDLFEDTEMEATKSPGDKALQALAHTPGIIRNHPHVGWYMGLGSKSFGLMTEAYAALTGRSLKETREHFAPQHAINPAVRGEEDCE